MNDHMERTARYVLISPLDDEDIIATFLYQVANGVLVTADVTNSNLFTWQLWSHHSDHQHVDACNDQFCHHQHGQVATVKLTTSKRLDYWLQLNVIITYLNDKVKS